MKILIVDDDNQNRYIFSRILSKFGKCDEFRNGLEAKEAFIIAHEMGNPYELIISDLIMPELDGIGLIKEIRGFEYVKSVKRKASIFIISGYYDIDNICEKYGVYWFLKPISLVELSSLVEYLSDNSLCNN